MHENTINIHLRGSLFRKPQMFFERIIVFLLYVIYNANVIKIWSLLCFYATFHIMAMRNFTALVHAYMNIRLKIVF